MIEYIVLNRTDGVLASQLTYETKEDAQGFIDRFREAIKSTQGYYLTSRWERIDPDDVVFEIIETVPNDDDFYGRYNTQYNHFEMAKPERTCEPDDMCSFGGKMYETYGAELEYIQEMEKTNPKRVWTIIEGDNDKIFICSGFHFVNRMGYLITEEDREKENEDYVCD